MTVPMKPIPLSADQQEVFVERYGQKALDRYLLLLHGQPPLRKPPPPLLGSVYWPTALAGHDVSDQERVPKGEPGGGRFGKGGGRGGSDVGHALYAHGTGTKDDPIKTNDPVTAARALGKGQHVELDQPRTVSTMLDRIQQFVHDQAAAGNPDRVYNLCNATIAGTNLFCVESQGIPRVEMPQLSGVPLPGSKADEMVKSGELTLNRFGEVDLGPGFIDYLKKQGIGTHDETVPAEDLRASQNELNGRNVAGLVDAIEGKPDPKTGEPMKYTPASIFVSKDDYIVDGHHRWAANVAENLGEGTHMTMPVKVVEAPILDVLKHGVDYTTDMGIPPLGARAKLAPAAALLAVYWPTAVRLEFDESKHPRGGNPKNAGEFSQAEGDKQGEGKGEPGTKGNPIKTGDVAVAAKALAEEKYVELDQPRTVSTLLNKLKDLVDEADAKGEKAPNYDLCKVSVPGTNLFCEESKGIPRVMMPQLSGKPIPGSPADKLPKDKKGEVNIGPAFVDYLENRRDIDVKDTSVPAENLRASQRELNGGKVAGMVQGLRDGTMKPGAIFVTKDDYVVDGHHRWAANVSHDIETGQSTSMPVRQINMSIIPLLAIANNFADRMGIPPANVAQREARKTAAALMALLGLAEVVVAAGEWDEAKHPRGGDPANTGRFSQSIGDAPMGTVGGRPLDNPAGYLKLGKLMGISDIPGTRISYRETAQAKTEVAQQLSSRMMSSTSDILAAAGLNDQRGDPGVNIVRMWDGELQTYRGAQPGTGVRDVVPANDQRAESLFREMGVQQLVSSWSTTSNDSPVGLAMQRAASAEFGLNDTASWKSTKEADQAYQDHASTYRDFLRTQYNETQDALKSAGITDLTLYRGYNFNAGGPSPRWARTAGETDLQTRPMSSWSATEGVAQRYAYDAPNELDIKGAVVTDTVPADRILSFPRTGMGSLHDKEFVVLGGKDRVTVKTPVGEKAKYAMAALQSPEANYTAASRNEDWLRTQTWDLPPYPEAFQPGELEKIATLPAGEAMPMTLRSHLTKQPNVQASVYWPTAVTGQGEKPGGGGKMQATDERGRYSSGGGGEGKSAEPPKTPKLKAEPSAAVRMLALQNIEKAKAHEEKVTAAIQTALTAADLGGELRGYPEHVTKEPDSLASKIALDVANRDQGTTPEQAAAKINDNLRYTAAWDGEHYSAGVTAMVQSLKDQGFTPVLDDDGDPKFKNFWPDKPDGNTYKGINLQLQTPDGYQFELQLHTPESFDLKQGELHDYYKEDQQPNVTPERRDWLDKKMKELTSTLTNPPGVDQLRWPS